MRRLGWERWVMLGMLASVSALFLSTLGQVQTNRRAIRHLCELSNTTALVWEAALKGGGFRPGLTRAMTAGVASIRTDRACPKQ